MDRWLQAQDREGLGPALWGGCRNLGNIRRKDCSSLPSGKGGAERGEGAGVFLDSTGQKPSYPSEWVWPVGLSDRPDQVLPRTFFRVSILFPVTRLLAPPRGQV